MYFNDNQTLYSNSQFNTSILELYPIPSSNANLRLMKLHLYLNRNYTGLTRDKEMYVVLPYKFATHILNLNQSWLMSGVVSGYSNLPFFAYKNGNWNYLMFSLGGHQSNFPQVLCGVSWVINMANRSVFISGCIECIVDIGNPNYSITLTNI
jgi:hypothetical protein